MWPKPSRKAIPKKIREQVKAKFGGKCGYCGELPDKLQVDHIVPVEFGGTDDIENLNPACFACNNYKNVLSVESMRKHLQEQVTRARKTSVNFRLAERYGQLTVHEKPIKFYFELLKEQEETAKVKLTQSAIPGFGQSSILVKGRLIHSK